jgi:hypothetical protein
MPPGVRGVASIIWGQLAERRSLSARSGGKAADVGSASPSCEGQSLDTRYDVAQFYVFGGLRAPVE